MVWVYFWLGILTMLLCFPEINPSFLEFFTEILSIDFKVWMSSLCFDLRSFA